MTYPRSHSNTLVELRCIDPFSHLRFCKILLWSTFPSECMSFSFITILQAQPPQQFQCGQHISLTSTFPSKMQCYFPCILILNLHKRHDLHKLDHVTIILVLIFFPQSALVFFLIYFFRCTGSLLLHAVFCSCHELGLLSRRRQWHPTPVLHSSTLTWKISWTEEPGGLQSMGSLRVGHD